MQKIYSLYKEKEVNALPAQIFFEFVDRKTGAESMVCWNGYWLKTGEIAVNNFKHYEDFVLEQYEKASTQNLLIKDAVVVAQGVDNCFGSIRANSDGKCSYTNTAVIKAEIKKIKIIEKEKKLLEKTLSVPQSGLTINNKKISKI